MISIVKHLGLAPSNKLFDDRVGGGAVGKIKREMKMTLNQCQVLPKCMLLTKTVKSFFYPYTISQHDEQNVLNLELALFHLQCKISTKQFFGGRKKLFACRY
jgi:hypothetical protein